MAPGGLIQLTRSPMAQGGLTQLTRSPMAPGGLIQLTRSPMAPGGLIQLTRSPMAPGGLIQLTPARQALRPHASPGPGSSHRRTSSAAPMAQGLPIPWTSLGLFQQPSIKDSAAEASAPPSLF
jgi:hypothetical protein